MEVRVWDASSGTERHTLTGHTRRVNSVSWSADARWVVSGSDDKTVRVWDASSGEELSFCHLESNVTALAVHHSPATVATDERAVMRFRIAVGTERGFVWIFQVEDGLRPVFRHHSLISVSDHHASL